MTTNYVYCLGRCRKQRQMAIAASSPKALKIYATIARLYAERSEMAMYDLTFPRFKYERHWMRRQYGLSISSKMRHYISNSGRNYTQASGH
jgi:hypothetical protein